MKLSFPIHRSAFVVSVAAGLALLPAPSLAAKPTISDVSPATVTSNVAATLTATVSSDAGIQSCELYVDLNDAGPMTVTGSTASASYTFTSGGSRIAFVFCHGNDGEIAAGPNTAIWVNGAITGSIPFSGGGSSGSGTPPATTSTSQNPAGAAQAPAATGSLIKLECTADATPDDPCRAVYYRALDGKRHAFPNSKVFFTWFKDFSSVTTVSAQVMGSSLLGKNMTYRPGVKMVKFATLNHVYAVAPGGLLRWVTTEGIAKELYGADWNTKIDDIPDTYYGNYTFGQDITSASDFDLSTTLTAGANIETSL